MANVASITGGEKQKSVVDLTVFMSIVLIITGKILSSVILLNLVTLTGTQYYGIMTDSHDRYPSHDKSPLSKLDHATVALYVGHKFLSTSDAALQMNRVFRAQRKRDSNLLDKLQEIGRAVEPVDPVFGVDQELPALKAFLAGSTVALETLDMIALELGITTSDFRNFWKKQTEFVRLVQPHSREDMTPQEFYAQVGMGIMDTGQRELYGLDQAYKDLIEKVDDTNVISFTHSNVFKASFGYLTAAGMHAFSKMLEAQDLAVFESEALKEDRDWNEWLRGITKNN